MIRIDPDSSFGQVLKKERVSFNERIAQARTLHPGFDIQALSSWLCGAVSSLAQGMPQFPSELASACLETSIELVSHGLISGSDSSQFQNIWITILPRCPTLLLSYPQETLGTLHNAALAIRSYNGNILSTWIDNTANLIDTVSTIPDLRDLCSVVAWKSGLAHYRTSALEAAQRLPEKLVRRALKIPADDELKQTFSRFINNRWFVPDQREQNTVKVMHELGTFTGFGGKFPSPPTVRSCHDALAIQSGDQYFWLYADAFGALILRGLQKDTFEALEGNIPANSTRARMDKGFLSVGTNQIEIKLPEKGMSVAQTDDTIAVFSPWSYSIIILSLPVRDQP